MLILCSITHGDDAVCKSAGCDFAICDLRIQVVRFRAKREEMPRCEIILRPGPRWRGLPLAVRLTCAPILNAVAWHDRMDADSTPPTTTCLQTIINVLLILPVQAGQVTSLLFV